MKKLRKKAIDMYYKKNLGTEYWSNVKMIRTVNEDLEYMIKQGLIKKKDR